MTWKPGNLANEAAKIKFEIVPWMRGVCLDVGAGPFKVWPHFMSVDSGREFGRDRIDVVVETAERLPLFASGSVDCVFSSHLLEHIIDYKAALKEWWRVLKHGGFLILYLPDEDEYPKVGKPGANIDHHHNISHDFIVEAMEEISGSWDLCDFQKRNKDDEYSLFFVFAKQQGSAGKHTFSWKDPKPEKTCGVVRYGAIGDCVQTSSLLPWLKEQGYHITFYCQAGHGHEAILHDPHIDRFIVQERDAVHIQVLSEYLDYEAKKYHKFVNLCESVEASLLPTPTHMAHRWPNAVRALYCDHNYLEFTHLIAGVPPPYRPKFYATLEEKAWARKKAGQWGKRNIIWSLSGSSVHKVWPHLDAVIAGIMLEMPDVHVVLVGDDLCKILETGWEKEPRVHCQSGEWTIRQSIAFSEVADLIIGSETGLLNAAGMLDVPKIVTLSHSSENALTKHWINTIALRQPEGTGCPKQPCFQLHYNWDHCMKHESGTAQCQFEITPTAMFEAIQSALQKPARKVA